MGAPIKISDELVEAAKQAAAKRFRSVPKQIEYWAHLGRQLEARQARRLKELEADLCLLRTPSMAQSLMFPCSGSS